MGQPQPQMGYPAGGQPGMQQPGMQQPMMGQPGMQQPGMQQPGMQQPMMSQQPGMMNQQPGMMNQQPGMQQPMMGQQPGMMGQPGMQQPGMQPMMGQQPGMQQPMMGQQLGMQQPMMGQQPGMMQPQFAQSQVGMNPPLGRISLVKGQNMSLTKAAPNLRHARVGLGWDARQTSGAAFDLDASCFLLNAQNQVAAPQNFVFYNNRQSMDGSVIQHGDNLTGVGEGDDEQVSVDLTRVPQDVQRIVFVCSIYEADQRQQNFGMVQRAFIRVVDQDTQQEIVRFDLTEEACMWNCMMFGELYRYGAEWKFKALGNGMQGGLKAVGAQFGMQLA